MREYRIVTELNREKWADYVYKHPEGNIFQTPQAYEVYRNTRNWRPLFLAAVDGEENILGMLLGVIQSEFSGLFGKFTSRAVIWGGPLINYNNRSDKKIVDFLLKALDRDLHGRVLYLQLRNLWDFSDKKNYFINNRYEYKEHLNFLIDLSMGEENLWKGLYPATRNKIRKAEKEGLKIRRISSILDVEESYSILKEIYKRARIPLPHKDLFEAIYKILYSQGMANIFLALYKDKIIGTLCLLIFREKLYVWYAGSLPRYYDKHPNDILHWEAIKWGCQNGFKSFDFGGAGSPYKEYGVREFKRKFGGELVNYGRFEKIYRPSILKVVKAGLKLWNKL